MSHFVSISTRIKDIPALEAACQEMGLSFVENAAARDYSGAGVKGEFVVRLKGPFDIAVNRDKKGNYDLATDWWDGHVEKEVGKDFGRLLQLYAVHKTMKEVVKRGMSVQRVARQNGSIKLVIRGT